MDVLIEHDGGLRFKATSGEVTVTTGKNEDDPVGDGMSPGALFISALGMCVGTYVARFCARHEIAHEGMRVEVAYRNTTNPDRCEAIDLKIVMPGDVPQKYRKVLQRAADSCYITKSIEHQAAVNVSFEEAAAEENAA